MIRCMCLEDHTDGSVEVGYNVDSIQESSQATRGEDLG